MSKDQLSTLLHQLASIYNDPDRQLDPLEEYYRLKNTGTCRIPFYITYDINLIGQALKTFNNLSQLKTIDGGRL